MTVCAQCPRSPLRVLSLKIDLIVKVDERNSCAEVPILPIDSDDEIGILFQRFRQKLPISLACRELIRGHKKPPASLARHIPARHYIA
jgi:hypothetical protein